MDRKLLLLIVLIVLIAGCIQEGEILPNIEGKKALFIIAQENFRDEELSTPKHLLEEQGAITKVASITRDEAHGMLGLRITPDITVAEADSNEFDILILVGGSGSPKLADYPEVINIIKQFANQKKPIAAICLAPYILARSGILSGKTVTVYPSDFALAEIRRAGANYVKKSLVVDGNIITSPGPEAAKEFAEEIVKVLSEKN